MAEKIDIRSLTKQELIDYFSSIGEKGFKGKQVYQWLWQKGVHSFDEMTNLSLDLREELKKSFVINGITVSNEQISEDGTIKFAFKLFDDNIVEGVLIPTENRLTACVSSQVGCSLACKFCATGFLDRKRNLNPDEIYDQVALINRVCEKQYDRPLTNVVFMGMGEPLLAYNNVLAGIEKITSNDGMGMSPKRITVSTAGIAKMIKKLAEDKVKFNLALSLHAPTDGKRHEIMPINEHNNIDVLVEALNEYYSVTKNHITFEYILFDGFNDSIDDARELVKLCKRVPAKVNIIEYNPVDQVDFRKPSKEKTMAFVHYLEDNRVTAKVRVSRGKDIDAACGQLANKTS